MSITQKYDEAAAKLLDVAIESLESFQDPSSLLQIAEAIAWARFPNQPHGGQPVGG